MALPQIHFVHTDNGHYVAIAFSDPDEGPHYYVRIESKYFTPYQRSCKGSEHGNLAWAKDQADRLIKNALNQKN